MAIVIDTSTPGPVTIAQASTTTTSGTFSPPANSVIFIFFAMTGPAALTVQTVSSVTDSLGAHLGWSLFSGSRDNIFSQGNLTGTAEVWWASCPSAQTNMTVTANYSQSNNSGGTSPSGLMQIIVFTGASFNQTGNSSIRNSTTTATPSQNLTTSANNSWV